MKTVIPCSRPSWMMMMVLWISSWSVSFFFQPVVPIDPSVDNERELFHNVEGEQEQDMSDQDRHLLELHSHFLRPEEMQEFRRFLRQGKPSSTGGSTTSGGYMNSGLTSAELEVIQDMVRYRGNMQRTVTPVMENGALLGTVSVTVSEDPKTAQTIQTHVLGMKALVEAGRVARQFDPLYVELFQHIPEYQIQVDVLEKGIRVTETGENPCAAALVVAHSDTVSKFILHGQSEVLATHPVPEVCVV